MSDWLPLDGVTVVDVSQQLPGPFGTLLLATLGACVVKIEPPGGEHGRSVDPPMFERTNAGKEIRFLDLKSEAGRAELHALADGADVFVEGFRPGVVQRLACDWETLSARNPRLVYVSLSGYGQDGPSAMEPGHDLNFLARSGGLPAGLPDGEALIRVPWVDLASATTAVLLVVAALHDRERTGAGRRLELALLDAAAVWSATKVPRAGTEGAYGVFATADDRRVALSVLETPMWRRLCTALGWTDWLDDPALDDVPGRRSHGERIASRTREALAARTADELMALAAAHDLPLSVVVGPDDIAGDPQLAARRLFPTPDTWRPLGPSARAMPVVTASVVP